MSQEPVTMEDLRELLKQNLEVAKDNRKLLRDMKRDAFIGSIVKTLIWVLLIGASFYYSMKFIEPYLTMMDSLKNGEQQDYGALFEEYKHLIGQ